MLKIPQHDTKHHIDVRLDGVSVTNLIQNVPHITKDELLQ